MKTACVAFTPIRFAFQYVVFLPAYMLIVWFASAMPFKDNVVVLHVPTVLSALGVTERV